MRGQHLIIALIAILPVIIPYAAVLGVDQRHVLYDAALFCLGCWLRTKPHFFLYGAPAIVLIVQVWHDFRSGASQSARPNASHGAIYLALAFAE